MQAVCNSRYVLCSVKLYKPKERGFLSLLFVLNTDHSCCLSKVVAVGDTRNWEEAADSLLRARLSST